MRVTDGRLDLASSHAYAASPEAPRQVQATDRAGRVVHTDDVKSASSGAPAAPQPGDIAPDLPDAARGSGPGLGRGMGIGHGFGNGRGLGLGHGVSAMRADPPPPAAIGAPAVPAPEAPSPTEAEIARQAWMLLFRTDGDAHGAARLAARLAAFARTMDGAGDVAAVLDQVVAEYNTAAAAPASDQPGPEVPATTTGTLTAPGILLYRDGPADSAGDLEVYA
jgi:hypothetical protein